ncbi:hypothetical protein RF11_11225 [Thelohanellus kitauei]|uniref:Uncharacterized protein n=1 Tax=Thelohanellus kitauei TaxID=669202 RepID=A0A0C2MSH5_THEKT|nr:hypothetical protein RF11_11225 [Thelohanellus kitauei]
MPGFKTGSHVAGFSLLILDNPRNKEATFKLSVWHCELDSLFEVEEDSVHTTHPQSQLRIDPKHQARLSPSLQDVTQNDGYNSRIKFSVEQKSTGPQAPQTCTTRIDSFKLFFNEEFLEKIHPKPTNMSQALLQRRQYGNILFGRIGLMADAVSSCTYTFAPYNGKISSGGHFGSDLTFTSRIVLHLYNYLKCSVPVGSGYRPSTRTIMTNKKGLPNQKKNPLLPKGKTFAPHKINIISRAWLYKKIKNKKIGTFNEENTTEVIIIAEF